MFEIPALKIPAFIVFWTNCQIRQYTEYFVSGRLCVYPGRAGLVGWGMEKSIMTTTKRGCH